MRHAFEPDHHLEVSEHEQMTLLRHHFPEKSPAHVLDAAASSRHLEVINHVAQHAIDPETIRKVVKNTNHGADSSTQRYVIQNKHVPDDVIDAATKHEDSDVREDAVRHERATEEHIMTGLKDRDKFVQVAAALNPNLTKKHVDYVLNNADKKHGDGKSAIDPHVVRIALKSNHVSSEHIKKFMSHPIFGAAVLKNPNVTKEHLLHALDSPDDRVAEAAAKHENVDHDVLAKAVLHKSGGVLAYALVHRKMTPALFAIAKTHPDPRYANRASEAEQDFPSMKKY